MIRLENVVKTYGETRAVDGLSMEVAEGELCALIGPSGCGKTTTLRMINRLIEPTSGRIYVNGVDTVTVKPERLRRSIGYAIQSVGLFPHMTVAENIAVVPKLLNWDSARIEGRVHELLVLVGLDPSEHASKYPSQLSGGEAQRIGVARALAADPPILLMDEPFEAVDPLTRERLQAQFAHIQQGLKKTVVFVTHDLDEAIRLADRVAIMSAGTLVQYDTPEAILASPANKFVHDFVGTDRALKRLARIGVKRFARPAASVQMGASAKETLAAIGNRRSAWVVMETGRLVGWVDRAAFGSGGSLREALVEGDPEEIAVSCHATLREALSRMLGQGFKSMAVVDREQRLVGEITLADVEAATAEGEA